MSNKDIAPDWTQAPEGATHYGPAGNGLLGCWYKHFDGEWYAWMASGDIRWDWVSRLPSNAIPRPAAWNGQGLPLSGTDIEYLGHLGKWKKGKYLGEFNGQSVCGDYETGAVGYVEDIRPVRTPEQIAAEKREKAIIQMLAIFDAGVVSSLRQHARNGIEALYDAGYTKPTE